MNTVIIGGGITGLVAAYKLSKKGFKVTVFESSYFLGGQASVINIGGNKIERGYHHLFKNDKEIIELIEELDLSDSLKWFKSSVGMYSNKKLYPFSTPKDLLSYKPLSLISRIRLGFVSLYLQRQKNWKKYEKVTAKYWINKYAGKEIFTKIWGPLLKSKFGYFYNKINMSWFWSKMITRFASRNNKGEEILGYLINSFDEFIDKLVYKINDNGGQIFLNSKVISINHNNNIATNINYEINDEQKKFEADIVISTVPNFELKKIVKFNKNFQKKLDVAKYLGASVFILKLKKKFSPYYWINIIDEDVPFLGLIEHTNLVSEKYYNGDHILYITNYLDYKDKIFKEDKEKLLDKYVSHLEEINPNFKKEDIESFVYNSVSAAQPLLPINYSILKPEYQSPINNLYIGNTSQIYPEDRGTNYSVKIAGEIVSLISRRINER
tara:strand:- start:472 stop:1788 length:1317 start_codon:yes stop_codon:yes gene_type:complete